MGQPHNLPCPLSDVQCQQLEALIDQIPKVQAIVQECTDCGIQIPGAGAALANSLTVAKGVQSIIARHFSTPQS